MLDTFILGEAAVLRSAIIFFFLANEGLSITENAAHLGLPIPDALNEVLQNLHNRAGKSGHAEEVYGDPIDEEWKGDNTNE